MANRYRKRQPTRATLKQFKSELRSLKQAPAIDRKDRLWENIRSSLIVGFTGILAFYTGYQVMTQEKLSKIEMRAYLTVKGVTPHTMEDGKNLKANIHFTNVGKTPAYEINIANGMKTGGSGIYKEELNRTEVKKIGNLTLASLLDIYSPVESPDKINIKQLTEIMSGKRNWYVFGTITYEDIFGDSHFTRFCFEYVSNDAFEACQKHNDAN